MPFGAEEGISLDRSGPKSPVSYGHVALPWLLLPARSNPHCTESVGVSTALADNMREGRCHPRQTQEREAEGG